MPLVNIFDSPGDVFSTALIWLLGFVITVRIARFLNLKTKRAFYLYLWHSLLCFGFTYFTHVNGADAANYYLNALNGDVRWSIGTSAISLIAYLPVYGLNLSYFGANLLFSIFSMIGLLFMDSVLQDIRYGKRQITRWICASLVFFPSVHFWTGAVGKDSLMLLGAGLIIWALQSLKTRYIALLFSLLIFSIVRPHMAITFMLSYGISTVLRRNTNVIQSGFILGIFGSALYLLIPIFISLVGLEGANLSDVSDYVNNRQSYDDVGGSAISLQNMNFFSRIFAFLFRPTILEARNILGIISALENAVLLMSFAVSAITFSFKGSQVQKEILGRFTLLIYGIAAMLILGQLTYNLGLAARQKWMVIPLLWVALIAYSRPRKFRPPARSFQ